MTEIINRTLQPSQVQKHATLYIYNNLAFDAKRGQIKRPDKSRITSAEIKCIKTTAKYTQQDGEHDEAILSELKIKPDG